MSVTHSKTVIKKSQMTKKAKLFIGIQIVICLIIFIYGWSQFHGKIFPEHEYQHHTKNESVKYILQWTLQDTIPFVYMGEGQKTFLKRKCPVQNCYVTADKHYFDDISNFDLILFHGPELHRSRWPVPSRRSPDQRYVFVSLESAHYYPICKDEYNDFFNWTWSYRLDSDVHYDYLKIRDIEGKLIGPNKIMHWMKIEDMQPIDEHIKAKLVGKRKAAAWFVSNCKSLSLRESFVENLQKALRPYGLFVDIYGVCGKLKCPNSAMSRCLKSIEKDYYFYLSFENSFSEDYVTEKLLHALQNYAVPIVFGGANYTRFMPDGIYLDAHKLGVKALAKEINDIIENKEKYFSFFKWHNHYSYHHPSEAPDSDDYCQLCASLNNTELMTERTVYHNFKQWWAGKRC